MAGGEFVVADGNGLMASEWLMRRRPAVQQVGRDSVQLRADAAPFAGTLDAYTVTHRQADSSHVRGYVALPHSLRSAYSPGDLSAR
ncbi:hypothetical protein [Streptomyces sp. NBC_00306]|uniref:hypothetical protein n=1 Tax=Streptomyces sp. NBC_00306 TaxID=2975708 RepID=UPI002E2B3F72|nr:hypothetical protein [Streptomyces sp. NBC_00306]